MPGTSYTAPVEYGVPASSPQGGQGQLGTSDWDSSKPREGNCHSETPHSPSMCVPRQSAKPGHIIPRHLCTLRNPQAHPSSPFQATSSKPWGQQRGNFLHPKVVSQSFLHHPRSTKFLATSLSPTRPNLWPSYHALLYPKSPESPPPRGSPIKDTLKR